MDRSRGEAGQGLAEFVLAAPILLLLIFGILEFGRHYYTRLTLRHAVAEAARFAVTGNQLTDPESGEPIPRAESIRQVIAARTDRLGLEPEQITLDPPDGGGPEEIVRIDVRYRFEFILPPVARFFPDRSVEFTISTAMRNEPFF